MKDLKQVLYLISALSFFAGLLAGRLLGLNSKRFKGKVKGKHNLKIIKK